MMLPLSLHPQVSISAFISHLLAALVIHIPLALVRPFVGFAPSEASHPNRHVSFHDLPDEVLLEVILNLDLLSILALRRTDQHCFRLSKSPAVWVNIATWLTAVHPNILSAHRKPISSYSEDIESVVIQAVRVERGWTRTRTHPPQPFTFFPAPAWVSTIVPGGRWFIAGTADGSGRVLYYDLEHPDLAGRTLFTFTGINGADARELTLQVVQGQGEPTFQLAVVFSPPAHYLRPDKKKRIMTLWCITVDCRSPLLHSHLQWTTDVYQNPACPYRSLSLGEGFIARASIHPSGATFLFVYNTKPSTSEDPKVLMPSLTPEGSQGICLTRDHRILALFKSWIGLYSQPSIHWRGSGPVPGGLSKAKPQWTYSLQNSYEEWMMGMSKPWYNLEGILSISVFDCAGLHLLCLRNDGTSMPDVRTIQIKLQSQATQICLGTFRGLQTTWESQGLTQMTFMEQEGLAALRAFAGVKDRNFSQPASHVAVDLAPCPTPQPSTTEYCQIDEHSGIVLFPVSGWFPVYHVLCLAD